MGPGVMPWYTTADARRDAERQAAQRKQAMQATLNLKIERTETGEFIAYFPGDYHIGYGATASDARDALLWSMENE
jgi:hypothetical protein